MSKEYELLNRVTAILVEGEISYLSKETASKPKFKTLKEILKQRIEQINS